VRVHLPLALRGLGDVVCLPFSIQARKVKKLGMKKLLERRTMMSDEGREIKWTTMILE
jgi:hypothetical protein